MEILSKSTEPEKVFQISKIINHPRYQPNRVIRIDIGQNISWRFIPMFRRDLVKEDQ